MPYQGSGKVGEGPDKDQKSPETYRESSVEGDVPEFS